MITYLFLIREFFACKVLLYGALVSFRNLKKKTFFSWPTYTPIVKYEILQQFCCRFIIRNVFRSEWLCNSISRAHKMEKDVCKTFRRRPGRLVTFCVQEHPSIFDFFPSLTLARREKLKRRLFLNFGNPKLKSSSTISEETCRKQLDFWSLRKHCSGKMRSWFFPLTSSSGDKI